MKKSTANKIIVVFIIFIFFSSSFAFFIIGFGGSASTQQNQFTPLENFIVDGELDSFTESVYFQNGFTILKFYYSDQSLISYADQLPNLFQTNNGQTQLIVQKIPSEKNEVHISSLNGEETIENPTEPTLFDALCKIVLLMPIECGIQNIISNVSAG